MKRLVVPGVALALLCVVGIALQWRTRPAAIPGAMSTPPPSTVDSPTPPSPANTPPIVAVDEDATPPPNAVADRPRVFTSTTSPTQARAGEKNPFLQSAHQALRDYQLRFHQNPTGNNAEITRALNGKNAQTARFLPASSKVNDRGEMVDNWGQPLFFHQISAASTEIRSAGPDHVMWTGDDEVLR